MNLLKCNNRTVTKISTYKKWHCLIIIVDRQNTSQKHNLMLSEITLFLSIAQAAIHT